MGWLIDGSTRTHTSLRAGMDECPRYPRLEVREEGPSVSVVIPTRNRSRRLRALLASLREQTISADQFEVIVVDDGSVDGTQEVLAAEAAARVLTLRSIRQ